MKPSVKPRKKRPLPKGMTPWKPGQSGNPKGRPPNDKSITLLLRETGASNDAEKFKELVRVLWDMALVQRNEFAINLITNRIDGRLPLPIPGLIEGTEVLIRIASSEDGEAESE